MGNAEPLDADATSRGDGVSSLPIGSDPDPLRRRGRGLRLAGGSERHGLVDEGLTRLGVDHVEHEAPVRQAARPAGQLQPDDQAIAGRE